MKRLLLILGSIAAASAALATTYVRVEKDGTKTYSDRPIPGGQVVVLESAQTYSSPPAATNSAANQDQNIPSEQRLLREMDDFSYQSCTISPENDATFTNPENVSVSVQTAPVLRPGDLVTLTVDGQAAPANSPSYVLQPANRGTHTVQVTIKDGYGRVLCSATAVFHVMRPSLNMPGRR